MCGNFCRTCYSRLQQNERTSRRRDALHHRILFCWLRDPIKSSFELISGISTIWYWHVSVVLCERSQPTVTKSSISFLRYIMMDATHQASRLLALISIDIAGGMITGTNTLTMSESLRFFSCRFVFREWDVWVVIDRSFLEGEKSWHHDEISRTRDEMFEKSIKQTSCIKWLLRRTVQCSTVGSRRENNNLHSDLLLTIIKKLVRYITLDWTICDVLHREGPLALSHGPHWCRISQHSGQRHVC